MKTLPSKKNASMGFAHYRDLIEFVFFVALLALVYGIGRLSGLSGSRALIPPAVLLVSVIGYGIVRGISDRRHHLREKILFSGGQTRFELREILRRNRRHRLKHAQAHRNG